VERRELDITERVGSVGIETSAPSAVIGVPNAESPAYRAGLRTFDIVTNVGGLAVRRFKDLNEAFSDNAGETMPITYLRPVPVRTRLAAWPMSRCSKPAWPRSRPTRAARRYSSARV